MKRALLAAALAGSILIPTSAHAAGSWHSVTLPFLWPHKTIYSLDASAPDNVWITGNQGAFCIQFVGECLVSSPGNPVVRRWTGTSWTEYPLNGWTGQGTVEEVETGGGQTWIHGNASDGAYLGRFTGTSFTKVTPPAGGWTWKLLNVGPSGVWTVATDSNQLDTLSRWNGSGWTATPKPASMKAVLGIVSSGPSDAWAAGLTSWGGNGGDPEVPVFAHWNGTAWQELPAPPGDERLRGLSTSPSGDVWAITSASLHHWNGTSWTVVPTPSGAELLDVAVGSDGIPFILATVPGQSASGYRYHNGVFEPVPAVFSSPLVSVTAIPGTDILWGLAADASGQHVVTNG